MCRLGAHASAINMPSGRLRADIWESHINHQVISAVIQWLPYESWTAHFHLLTSLSQLLFLPRFLLRLSILHTSFKYCSIELSSACLQLHILPSNSSSLHPARALPSCPSYPVPYILRCTSEFPLQRKPLRPKYAVRPHDSPQSHTAVSRKPANPLARIDLPRGEKTSTALFSLFAANRYICRDPSLPVASA